MDRAPRNRTLRLSPEDLDGLRHRLLRVGGTIGLPECRDRTILGNMLEVLPCLPPACVDLAIIDPPYNLTRNFGESCFRQRPVEEYREWLRSWVPLLLPILKPRATLYVCSEWRTSSAVQQVLEEHFQVRNRITWEREKGRGAQRNWKNCSEDIWFCTVGDDFHFDVDAVKQKRRVLAPYRDAAGRPKDWSEGAEGAFRETHPSNLWTDISVPFWSMPENTDHPTQKPEKLVAKLVLASSRAGDLVLDPFLGSGTTSVVSRKLGRHFIGIEREEDYCLLAEKRLELAASNSSIQGYSDGCFWERNTTPQQRATTAGRAARGEAQVGLFGNRP